MRVVSNLLRCVVLCGLLILGRIGEGQTLTVLHRFTGYPNDGTHPLAGVTLDSSGNLYGTTPRGRFGEGIVFEVDTSGAEKILHSFYQGNGGAVYGMSSMGGLVLDGTGNIFGTTDIGGDLTCNPPIGCGVVFKLDPDGNEAVQHRFRGKTDGEAGFAGLIRDSDGNRYGTMAGGGAFGQGTVFKLDGFNKLTVLHTFTGGIDGGFPWMDLTRDSKGNLYGTTTFGGSPSQTCPEGCGVVFQLDSKGNETVLYSFNNGKDGGYPYGGVVLDSSGSLYGTANSTVFKLDSTGHFTVLYTFTGGSDGQDPTASLVLDPDGNLYGTTFAGGTFKWGTIFRVDPSGNETVLYSFTGKEDGGGPFHATLVRDSVGDLYGTTLDGGDLSCDPPHGCGVVFKLTP
jgi:uncharacterized repeat protein (TIGR03803 family)